MDAVGQVKARRALHASGTALMVFAIVQELALLVGLVMQMQQSEEASARANDMYGRLGVQIGQSLAVGWMILGLIVTSIILFGALRMRSGGGRGLALIAAFLAFLPFTCTCVFGPPFAVWALVVLFRSDVKELHAGGGAAS